MPYGGTVRCFVWRMNGASSSTSAGCSTYYGTNTGVASSTKDFQGVNWIAVGYKAAETPLKHVYLIKYQ